MEILLSALIFALLLAAYLAWRLHANIKRLAPIQTEVNLGVYLVTLVLVQAIARVVPMSRAAALFLLAAWLAASFATSFFIQRRYNRWVEKRQQEEKEAERRRMGDM